MFAATHFSPWTRSIPCRSSTVYFTTVQRHRTRPKLSTTTSAHSSSRRSSPDTTTWQTALVAATSAVPHPSPRAVASTIAALGKARQWQHACTVIGLLPKDSVDIVCYNALLTCLVRSDQPGYALRLFEAIPEALPRTAPTFGALISACAAVGHWERALHIVRHVMPTPNVIAYTSAIRALANAEGGARWDMALSLLDDMQAERVDPTAVTYGTVLDALAKADSSACSWERAVALLDKLGAHATVVHYGATLHACANAGKWRAALSLLGRMEHIMVRPNLIAHNSVLHALNIGGNWRHCVTTLATMQEKDVISVNTAIMACVQAHQWQHALQLLERYDTQYTDVVSYNGAIQACGRARQWARALYVFRYLTTHSALTPTPQSFHAILGALATCGKWQLAVHIFNHTDAGQTLPAIHAVLTACADARAWQYALSFLQHNGCRDDPAAVSNVMAACLRAGQWHHALTLFDRMVSQKNTETVGVHGQEGPDRIAYTIALQAASQARPRDVPALLVRIQQTFGRVDAAAYTAALRGTCSEEDSATIAHSALDACERWASGADPLFVHEASHAIQLLSLLRRWPAEGDNDPRRKAFVAAVWTRVLWPLIGHLKAGDVDAVRRLGIPTVGVATRDVLDCLGIGRFDPTGARNMVARAREEKKRATEDGTNAYVHGTVRDNGAPQAECVADNPQYDEGVLAERLAHKVDDAGQDVRARDVVAHVKSAHGERIFRYGQPDSRNTLPSVFLHHDRSGHAEQHALFDLLQREGCTSSPAALDGDDTARDGVHHVKEKHPAAADGDDTAHDGINHVEEKHPAAADGDDTAHDDVHHVKEKQATRVELYVTHRPCVSCVCAFVAFQNLAPHCELTVMFDELDGD
eukprot:GEMP01015538.1.p1 GENE.GEMP01015538.1~~GEMP01015538.1.p1  ORF type:complete len:872 (+),score=281.44 GEMP01015538.1:86-2701(+)